MRSLLYLVNVAFCLLVMSIFVQETKAFDERKVEWKWNADKRHECREKCPEEKDDSKRVCGFMGHWYVSKCRLECLGYTEGKDELCKCTDKCDKKVHPICGVSGKVHANECKMKCLKDEISADEGLCDCVDDCRKQPAKYICGEHGNWHYNDCSLACRKGVKAAKDNSACEKKHPS